MKRIQLPKKLLSALCAAALLVGAMPGALAAESTQQVSIQQQSIATNAGVFTYIDDQGGLWSWGHSLTGGVGNGTTSSTTGTPEKILDNVVFVSSGLNNNGAAIQSDGSLWVWGDTSLDMDYANQAWAPVRLEGVKVLLPDGTVSQPTEEPEQTELRHSGSTTLEKLSKEEIVQLLNQASSTLPNPVLTEEPSIHAPYATGAVDHQALEAAAQRLNVLRRLAGVPQVQLDDSLSENAQYGAVLLAHLGSLNHTPAKPADMDNSFYQKAYEATSTSNIAAGMDLLESVDMFMQDSDARNVERVGHRRWQLNPELGRVGFGYAQNPDSIYRDFVTEKVTDTSGSGCDYDFIGWPASGNFPNYLDSFDANTAWSVVLNPDDYQVPTQSGLVVTLVRQSDGKTWTLDGKASYTPAASGCYLNVETSGVGNCIIFRPDGVTKYEGVYQVTIDGLKDRSGKAVDFTYQVDFFSQPDNASKPSDWAAASVQEAIQLGVVPFELQTGYTQTATRQEICALVVRFYETVTGSPVQGRVSFSDTKDEDVEKAAYLGIVNGVGDGSFHPNDPLTREQAAVMLTRLAQSMSKHLPAAEANFTDRAEISPWALEATGAIQGCGVMNGVGGGRFAPSLSYSREQCITTLMRLYHYISK
ncbi:S-layer homology domain-containing protein [Flavonifractor sp. An112]|uniref:CAP and S-layer homology domain-containing protein n=1 Tax=Flavonifractor sp. An112 TaxID=1965544 RepID=UPI00174E5FD9|nr:S-layer homology domain-containing protein [Flavonifractor sp. An112]